MTNDAWINRDWHIIRADVELDHVFFPDNTLRFESDVQDGVQGYRLSHTCDGKDGDCFKDTFLVPAGNGGPPGFRAIAQTAPLPAFTPADDDQYVPLFDRIETYVVNNNQVPHLVGDISIPCHENPETLAKYKLAPHVPKTLKTRIHVYQIGDAVLGDAQTAIVRCSLSRPLRLRLAPPAVVASPTATAR